MGKTIRELLRLALSMKVVCAWCGKHLSGDRNDPEVSHGICDSCARQFER